MKVLLLSLLVLAGCTMVAKSSELIKQLERIKRHHDQFSQKVLDDYRSKEAIYAALAGTGAPVHQDPYPGFKTDIGEMGALAKQLRGSSEELRLIHEAWQVKLRGDSKIKSDEPIWNDFMKVKTRVEQLGVDAEAQANQYLAASNRFVARAKAHKIYEIEVPKVRAQVEQQLAALQTDVKKIQGQFGELRTKVGQVSKDDAQLADAQRKIDELERILKIIEGMGVQAGAIFEEFRKEAGTQERLFVAPHMASHTVAMRLEAKYGELNAEIAKFNAIGHELVKMFKK